MTESGREPAARRLGMLSSITLRSVYAVDDPFGIEAAGPEGPDNDALRPERWSNPPPPGLAPIIPVDEPDEPEPTTRRLGSFGAPLQISDELTKPSVIASNR